MKTRTVCLSPGRAMPGMMLAAPVKGHDGHILLAGGAELDAETLERLLKRGIETLYVQVLDTRDEDTIAQEMRAAEQRVEHIFRGEGSAARAALRAAVLAYRLESVR